MITLPEFQNPNEGPAQDIPSYTHVISTNFNIPNYNKALKNIKLILFLTFPRGPWSNGPWGCKA